MKLIKITDLQDFTYNVNPNQITRVEEYPKAEKIVVYLSDGCVIHTKLRLEGLLNLINR